jgi:hypothetical protein
MNPLCNALLASCDFIFLILLEILSLLKDLFINLISIDRRVTIISQEHDEVDFELGLDIALAPAGVSGLVINYYFYGFYEIQKFVIPEPSTEK